MILHTGARNCAPFLFPFGFFIHFMSDAFCWPTFCSLIAFIFAENDQCSNIPISGPDWKKTQTKRRSIHARKKQRQQQLIKIDKPNGFMFLVGDRIILVRPRPRPMPICCCRALVPITHPGLPNWKLKIDTIILNLLALKNQWDVELQNVFSKNDALRKYFNKTN